MKLPSQYRSVNFLIYIILILNKVIYFFKTFVLRCFIANTTKKVFWADFCEFPNIVTDVTIHYYCGYKQYFEEQKHYF